MGSKYTSSLLFLFFLLLGFASAAGSFISYEVLEHHESTGRSLLQAKKPCPVNFELQNYTIITSRCKGPNYNAKVCCEAFMEFACPFNEEINDMSTDCASTMFSYINLYGQYPPGLFSNLCKGDKEGLSCGEEHVKNGAVRDNVSTLLLLAIATSILLLLNVF